jgi:hypothetical protein
MEQMWGGMEGRTTGVDREVGRRGNLPGSRVLGAFRGSDPSFAPAVSVSGAVRNRSVDRNSRTRVSSPRSNPDAPPLPMPSDRELPVIKKQWILAVAVVAVALVTVAFVQARAVTRTHPDYRSIAYGPEGQPVAFPHNVHAGAGRASTRSTACTATSRPNGLPVPAFLRWRRAWDATRGGGEGPDGGPSPEILTGPRASGTGGADPLEPDLQGGGPRAVPPHAAHLRRGGLHGLPRAGAGDGGDPAVRAAPHDGLVPDLSPRDGCVEGLHRLPLLTVLNGPKGASAPSGRTRAGA